MGVKQTRKEAPAKLHFRSAWRLLIAGLLAMISLCANGQEAASAGPLAEPLPGVARLAAALSDKPGRQETLLTLLAVGRLVERAQVNQEQAEALESGFRQDREWLDRLSARYARVPFRGTQLDPAAWYLLLELDQQRLSPADLTSPIGPEPATLTRTLFDRSRETLAAATLPEVLPTIEREAAHTWMRALEAAASNPSIQLALQGLRADWFDAWPEAGPSGGETVDTGEDGPTPLERAASLLQAIAMAALAEGPPDERHLGELRAGLLMAIPQLEAGEAKDAGRLLTLAGAIDGLHDHDYLAFNETLLWLASDLLLRAVPTPVAETGPGEVDTAAAELPAPDGAPAASTGSKPLKSPGDDADSADAPAPYRSALPGLLSSLLPEFSQIYSGEFAEVDPRINANLAAVFDVMQYLQSGRIEEGRLRALRLEMADAVAQFVLQVPDMDFYFDQPVRRRISQEIDICVSIVASSAMQGGQTLSREQYDGCLESLVRMSETLLNAAELAGDPDGPFGVDQLQRELELTPWQRINYALGYLHDRHPRGCPFPDQPLPNPLEWANLATTVTWFASQAPVYFQTPENEALVTDMRQQGMDMLNSMMQQVDCISGTGAGLNDPVITGLADYREALSDLVAGVREAELAFRAARLKPGSDVVLHGDASQHTAFRSDGLEIGPCDPDRVCEMNTRLDATRALIGLFPDPYLIADQTRMGSLEICYDNVQWVERRSEPVREDDPWVANYFGHLSFDLIGRFRENGKTTNVFGSNLVSPDEYHYLFAAATDEVLEDSCPSEWVGSRIVTTLSNKGGLNVVPNRLTYLAAARRQPSQVIAANWSRNEEWRDAFVTGLGVTPYRYPADPTIVDRVNRHLKALYQAEQASLYSALLRPPHRGSGSQQKALFEQLADLSTRKALVRSYVNLFYPQSMIDSDGIRSLLEGSGGMLDADVLRRFRETNVAMSQINDIGRQRLEQFQVRWTRQPENVRRSGSPAVSVVHALLRLDALYREFFVIPRENARKAIELSPNSIDG